MNKGKLSFFIGCPRSGKSTIVNETWLHLPVQTENPRVVVCGDDIRIALSGDRYNYLTETYVSAIKYTMIRAYLNRGFDVLVDGTHTSPGSIKRLFEIDINASPWWIPCFKIVAENGKDMDDEVELYKLRADATGQSDLHDIIDRTRKQMVDLAKKYGENLTELRNEVKATLKFQRIV